MNKLDLVIENAAETDMLDIAEYIAKDNKTAAGKILKTFYKCFERLCLYADLGVSRSGFTNKNVKFYTVKKHYLIIYAIKDGKLHILRVLSAYQDICALL